VSIPRYPEYKESGVEWLGEVPAHWDTPPLYLRYDAVLGKMLDEKRLTRKHLVPYVRNVDVQWDRVNVDELPELDIEPHEFERFTLKPGDLLICEGGEVGRTAVWRGELSQCAFQKAIHRLRPRTADEDVRYFFYCMAFAAATEVFLAHGNPNTIPHLTGEKLRRYRFPTPPIDEQRAIAAFLDRETAKIDALNRPSQTRK
jgi:type I restriction enzyme, S subunit